jgi:hypothetical protein
MYPMAQGIPYSHLPYKTGMLEPARLEVIFVKEIIEDHAVISEISHVVT